MNGVDRVVEELLAGRLVLLPTDTVYGLACTADREGPTIDLYRLKGRRGVQPTALIAASVDALLAHLPELRGGPEEAARALFPGPYTLVLPNPAQRFPWLTGDRADTIGVRVPAFEGPVAEVVARVGLIVATSANLPGGRDPRRLGDVPAEIRAGVGAVLDGGELPGTPSTVIDLSEVEPRVVRAGAGDAAEALSRIASAHTQSLPLGDRPLTREG